MKRLGIIAAMDSEVKRLKESIEGLSTQVVAGTDYYVGKIGEQEVALTRCGIGKVSASIAAQVMISLFGVDAVINTGCAGGLKKGMGIGEMVISTATAEWDLDLEVLGFPRGFVTALDAVEAKADSCLAALLKSAIPTETKVHEGLVISGDQFVSTPAQRTLIEKHFPQALCVEMEGAAIGHVCAQNNVPFCIVRTMSDTADGDSDVNFELFSAQAGEKSAECLLRMMRR